MPSLASSLWNSCCCNSRSIARPDSKGTSAPDCTERLIKPTAFEALCGGQNCLAYKSTCSQYESAGNTSLTRPISFARSNENVSPLTISSIASDLPTMRAKRWVPPVPGNTPRFTSGRPILPAFSFARRRSHAIAISSPPPTVCPLSAASVSFGVCSSRLRVSLACRQKKYLKRGVTLLSIAMLAPAEKNFSPWPRITMTCTLSSKRAFRIASSSWCIISNVYVFAGGSSSSMMASPSSVRYCTSVLIWGSVIVAMSDLCLRVSLDEAAEEDARHEIRQACGVDFPRGVVPVVDPVHHAEEDVGGGVPIDRALIRRGLLEHRLEQVHVAPLDHSHAARGRLMREHLHFGHVLREKGDVVPDERLESLERVAGRGDGLLRPLQDPRKTALLNQRQEVLFPTHVVVHPGQRHPACCGQVAHRRRMVALIGEDPGGAGKQMVEALVVGAHGFERAFECAT